MRNLILFAAGRSVDAFSELMWCAQCLVPFQCNEQLGRLILHRVQNKGVLLRLFRLSLTEGLKFLLEWTVVHRFVVLCEMDYLGY